MTNGAGKLIDMPVVQFPDPSVLSEETHAGLRAMEQALASVEPRDADALRTWLAGGRAQWRRLRDCGLPLPGHRLTQYAHFDFDTDTGCARSTAEMVRLSQARQLVACSSEMSDQEFLLELTALHSGFNGNVGKLRDMPVFSAADAEGYAIRYPPPDQARASLIASRAPLARYARETPGFAALAFMVVLGAAHPFEDGNGRVARLMSNAILQESGSAAIYLPFHEVSYITDGSLILCLREAAYFGRWEPMAKWFHDLAALIPAIAREVHPI